MDITHTVPIQKPFQSQAEFPHIMQKLMYVDQCKMQRSTLAGQTNGPVSERVMSSAE